MDLCGASGAPVVIWYTLGTERPAHASVRENASSGGVDLPAFHARHQGSSDEDDYVSMPSSQRIYSPGWTGWSGGGVRSAHRRLGLSVGGSAAILASSRTSGSLPSRQCGRLESRATPAPDWVASGGLWAGTSLAFASSNGGWARFKSFAPKNVIGRSRCPFLLIHGSEDT